MRRATALAIALLGLITSVQGAASGYFLQEDLFIESSREAAFGGHFTFDAATKEMIQSRDLRSGSDVYSNLSPPGVPSVVFGLLQLDPVYGDQLITVGTGTINELALTVYNSDAGNNLPIITMNVEVRVRRDDDNSLLGVFSADIDFGAGLGPGYYAIVTFTNLDSLPTPIVADTTAIRVEQQRISHTGGANRMGIACFDPIQIGSSPDTMLFNGGVLGLPWPLNPGYRVRVIAVPPCPGDLDGDDDVDLSDLAILLANYGTSIGAIYEQGDLDGDSDVDLGDLAELLGAYGHPCE